MGRMMKCHRAWLIAALIASRLPSGLLAAQNLTDVSAIVERANLAAYYAGADGRA